MMKQIRFLSTFCLGMLAAIFSSSPASALNEQNSAAAAAAAAQAAMNSQRSDTLPASEPAPIVDITVGPDSPTPASTSAPIANNPNANATPLPSHNSLEQLLKTAVDQANTVIGRINLTNGGLSFNCETAKSLLLEPTTPVNPQFDKLWNDYVADTLTNNVLQPGCAPSRRSPPPGVKRVGVIILYHGFTACPQQFFEVSKLLAAEGYEVLMPLLPGHGKVPQANGKDDLTLLPGIKQYKDYYKFLDRMNAIVASAPGKHLVSGVSLGGALTAHAVEQAPGLYNCQLQVSPFFKLIAPMGTKIEHLVRYTPIRNILKLDFGPSCRKERSLGRGGYCDYTVNHASAVDAVGSDTLSQIRPNSTVTQIIGSEGDQAADVGAMGDAFRQYMGEPSTSQKSDAENVHFCIAGKDVEHEPISRYDSPQNDKSYLPNVVDAMANWAKSCEAIPAEGKSHYDKRYDRCTFVK